MARKSLLSPMGKTKKSKRLTSNLLRRTTPKSVRREANMLRENLRREGQDMSELRDKYPPSIITSKMDRCFICGAYGVEIHHIMGGANRKNSTKYGLVVPLCRGCHTGDNGVHMNKDRNDALKRIAQSRFEAKYSHDEWMEVFGRNYL